MLRSGTLRKRVTVRQIGLIESNGWVYDVHPNNGIYLVTAMKYSIVNVFAVDKNKNCQCGGSKSKHCVHIRAIIDYIKSGGKRAEVAAPPPPPDVREERLEMCPICNGPVSWDGTVWKCISDPIHYWKWRGESFGVKDFLTNPDHPSKQGAFYKQTEDERDAFLALAKQNLVALQGGLLQ